MDPARSNSGTAEENTGIPDDLRCKRSDGKQWRCHAMSMPDKTVCEKHYIQAKKRAANSAMRASLKKAKRNPVGESDSYLESKSDDMDSPHRDYKVADIHNTMLSMKQISYSPETPSFKNSSVHVSSKSYDELQRDMELTPSSVADSSKSRSEKLHATTGTSDGGSESSEDIGGQVCHQCRRDDNNVTRSIVWCLKCDKRGYCDECISKWYPDIPLEEIHRICPACRSCCNCKMCLRGDNMMKGKIREIPALEKLEHLFGLLSYVLPVIKQIHFDQCSELELERKLRGNRIDLPRMKLNADEQMCCDFCRIPIIDYHRHCAECSFDICIKCCQDVRKASKDSGENEDTDMLENQEKPLKQKMKLSDKLCEWKANIDGSVPCPPKEHGGCGNSPLMLKRIFKMNWVAKLVKNVDEMVNGCKMYDFNPPNMNSYDELLYARVFQDIKSEGISQFKKRWLKGEPVIVKEVCDEVSMLGWDPMIMWKGIQETTDGKMNYDNRIVKAINCFDRSEIDIELGQFIRGYSEGRITENNQSEMLVLKNWPSPSAAEEFLLYQRPEFISKLPLLEYIHSKWGLLNVAAKLPHYSLHSDVGPKILISYGMYDELGQGDSVNMLRFNMRDVVYLLVHTCEVKTKSKDLGESEAAKSPKNEEKSLNEPILPKSPTNEEKSLNDLMLPKLPTKEEKSTNEPMLPKSPTNEEKSLNDPMLPKSPTNEEKSLNDPMLPKLPTNEEKSLNDLMLPKSPSNEEKSSDEPMLPKSPTNEEKSLNEPFLPKSPISENNANNDEDVNIDSIEDDTTESQAINTTIQTTDNEKALKCDEDVNIDSVEEDTTERQAINTTDNEKSLKCDEDVNIDSVEDDTTESQAISTTDNEKSLKCDEDVNIDSVEDDTTESQAINTTIHTTDNEKALKCDEDVNIDLIEDDTTESQAIKTTDKEKALKCEDLNKSCEEMFTKNYLGAIWDIFRREDVPKLTEYMRLHWNEFGITENIIDDSPLHEGSIYLNSHHKRKLKEEFGIEPWSIEQHLGMAVFIPTGCPFQVRNLQSTVQLGLDFLFPESLTEAVRLAGEIRELPNDHDAKLQMLEVGKISLYAASSSIKEVQKLVLDPKLSTELAFEDPNLTKLVSMNLEKMTKQRQVACA